MADKEEKSAVASQDFQATTEMCFYCYEVLVQHFNKEKTSKRKKTDYLSRIPNDDCALFVTWKKDHELRGCKGTHSPLPLHEGLKYFSIVSAIQDYRFDPVVESEVSKLDCSVSLIFDFQTCDDCFDWEIGTHGIRIDFRDKSQQERSATFLPYVMTQYGWTKKQTIERLIQKSGCKDPIQYDPQGKPILNRLKTIRYRSSVSEATYDEFKKSS